MKKIISLLLSVCLIITILPLGSFATMVSATTEDTDANSVEVRIKEFVENYGRPLYNWLDSYNGAPTEENIDDVIFLSFYFSGIDTYAPYTYTKTEVEKIVDKHFVVDNLDLSLSSCYNAETDTYKPQSGGFGGVFVYEPTITQNEDIYNVTIPYILAGEDDITGNLFLQITEDLRIVKFCVKHSYSSDYDAKCNNCGFVRTVTDTSCYTYTISNGEATITDCDTSISGDVVIPSNLGGNPVTIIRSSAFEDCTNITSITIPDCITKIGSGASL